VIVDDDDGVTRFWPCSRAHREMLLWAVSSLELAEVVVENREDA
jgi:hypothetical protein